MPLLLKLDIEGSEWACIDALRQGTRRPSYIAMEAVPYNPALYDLLSALGYENFKWVSQQALLAAAGGQRGWGASSGPIGEAALDCVLGYGWRDLSSVTRLHSMASPSRRRSLSVDGSASSASARQGRRRDIEPLSDQGFERCGRWADLHEGIVWCMKGSSLGERKVPIAWHTCHEGYECSACH